MLRKSTEIYCSKCNSCLIHETFQLITMVKLVFIRLENRLVLHWKTIRIIRKWLGKKFEMMRRNLIYDICTVNICLNANYCSSIFLLFTTFIDQPQFRPMDNIRQQRNHFGACRRSTSDLDVFMTFARFPSGYYEYRSLFYVWICVIKIRDPSSINEKLWILINS